MYTNIRTLFIILSFLLLMSCSNKSNLMKNEVNVTTTNEMAPTQNKPQNDGFAKSQEKTIELEKAIKEKPTLYEQLQSTFVELDNRNPLNHEDNEFDSTGYLKFTMNLFKEFLNSEQAYTMSTSDYKKLSALINVFSVKSGRVFTYQGTSILFGDSGEKDFALFQIKDNGLIKVSVLYDISSRDVLNVIQPSEDKNLIVLTGTSRDGKPWRTFIAGFYVKNGIVSKTSILEDYNDDFWRVDSNDGTIFLLHSLSAETYINKAPGQNIIVEAGDAKLQLNFNNKTSKYVVQKN